MEFTFISEDGYFFTRLCFQRALAIIYAIAFLNILNQWRALLGSNGILSARDVLQRCGFRENPSIFYLNSSDKMFMCTALIGLFLALFAVIGASENYGYLVSITTWFLLWAIYLSFVNVGEIWYSFGWETMLLEVGFLAIFFGPKDVEPSMIVIWLLRWVLFRNMFGAGMIKLRCDSCWRDFTCLFYYYETQPMPNPLSRYFHHLPKIFHGGGVLFNHFVEILIPFFYFAPTSLATIAGIFTIIFQIGLIATGNLSFLNYLTIVMAIPCFNDGFFNYFFSFEIPTLSTIPTLHSITLYVLLLIIIFLSIRPIKNLLSKEQAMNRSFDRLHLVNTYGAFGSITRVRHEIIVEGTLDDVINFNTRWHAYEFKGKPGRLDKIPPLVAPYHMRLDWLMWFAAMSSYYYHPWILDFAKQLLLANKSVLKLLEQDPFLGERPRFLRMSLYIYQFEKPNAVNVWKRIYVGKYLPVVFLNDKGQIVSEMS